MTLEDIHQIALMQWAALHERQHPELETLNSSPNGGNRDPRTGALLKKTGVKAGMPDLHLPVARGGFNSLYLELKVDKGKCSTVQLERHKLLRRWGNRVEVAWGWEAARDVIVGYLEAGKGEL